MNDQTGVYMSAAGLVALLLYLVSATRIFPARFAPWLMRAAIAMVGVAILIALIETFRWYAAR